MSITDDPTRQILDGLRDVARRVRRLETLEFPSSREGDNNPASMSWGKIMRIPHDGGTVEIFEVNRDGLLSACAVAEPYDGIWVPPANIWGDFIVPPHVTLQAYNERTVIDGSITLSDGSLVKGVVIQQTVLGGSGEELYMPSALYDNPLYDYIDVYGFIGPSSGTAAVSECSVTITHTGTGDVYGILQDGGGIGVYDSIITVVQAGPSGDVYATSLQSGVMLLENNILYANSPVGVGYGGYVWSGDLEVEGGKAYGSTARFGKALP